MTVISGASPDERRAAGPHRHLDLRRLARRREPGRGPSTSSPAGGDEGDRGKRRLDPGHVVAVDALPLRVEDVDRDRDVDQVSTGVVAEPRRRRRCRCVGEHRAVETTSTSLLGLVIFSPFSCLTGPSSSPILALLPWVDSQPVATRATPARARSTGNGRSGIIRTPRPRTRGCAARVGEPKTCSAGPYSTSSPRYMKPTWSAIRSACCMLWVTITIATSSRRRRISSSITWVERGSSAEQGSSSSSTSGRAASARAMQSRCCWPPERRSAGMVERRRRPRPRARRGAGRRRPARLQRVLARPPRALLAQRVGDVVEDAHRERVGLLEDHADPAAQLGHLHRVDVLAVERDAAAADRGRGDLDQPVERAQQRRLAAAGGADQRQHLALADRQRHLVDRELLAVGDRDLLDPHPFDLRRRAGLARGAPGRRRRRPVPLPVRRCRRRLDHGRRLVDDDPAHRRRRRSARSLVLAAPTGVLSESIAAPCPAPTG